MSTTDHLLSKQDGTQTSQPERPLPDRGGPWVDGSKERAMNEPGNLCSRFA